MNTRRAAGSALPTLALTGLLLSACTTDGRPVGSASTGTGAAPTFEFAIGTTPTSTFDEKTASDVDLLHEATFVGDDLLVDMNGSAIASFRPTDSSPAWTVRGFGDQIGAGSTRSLDLRTSSAAGGIALIGYSEECYWEEAPCTGAPEGTNSIIGIAAVSAGSKKVVWRSELATAGPRGSKTFDAGIYLEPDVTDADGRGVLVTLSSKDGRPTPGGLDGMTTYLLDAETGKVQWKTAGFRGLFLTDGRVFGQAATDGEDREVRSTTVTRSVRRTDGAAAELTLRSTAPQNVESSGGAGMLLQDTDTEKTDMNTRNLYLLGADGARVATGADDQNLSQATCPRHRTQGLLACAVMARSTPSVLVTWADGEPAPSSVTAPVRGHQQLWAVSGDTLLISENGYQQNGDAATWFAARRDGTVISERYPGVAIAASEKYVLVKNLDADKKPTYQVWPITRHP